MHDLFEVIGMAVTAAGGMAGMMCFIFTYSEAALRKRQLMVQWLIAALVAALVSFDGYRTFSPVAVDKPAPPVQQESPIPEGCKEVQSGVFMCEQAPGVIFDRSGHKIGELQ